MMSLVFMVFPNKPNSFTISKLHFHEAVESINSDKKEEIRLSPMTKAPTPTEMSKGQSDNTNNATKKTD